MLVRELPAKDNEWARVGVPLCLCYGYTGLDSQDSVGKVLRSCRGEKCISVPKLTFRE